MRFELVPNEILLDLFDYLNGIDLLRAFYGLNFRFNLLLYKQYRSFRFQFNNISKHDFDMVCQQHLPYIADKVMTIELSNYRETPEEINLFLCYIPSFKIFIYLQSLTISHLQSYGILLKLLDEFQHLINLMHLCFYACSFSVSSPNSQMIIDKIWSLPKLTHCNINLSINGQRIMCLPTIISVSLRSVRLCNSGLQWNQINQMIGYTPHLKYLMAYIRSFPTKNDIQCSLSALTKCKLCVTDMSDVSSTSIWFPPMTNLRCLEIDLWSGLITGDQWENIIRNYTPQLKVFRLRMEASFYSDLHIKQKADELFDFISNAVLA